MKRFASPLLGMLLFVSLVIASERRAWGYVDPGSGLLALQGAASFVATVAYYFRRKIRALFSRKPVSDSTAYVAKSDHGPPKAP